MTTAAQLMGIAIRCHQSGDLARAEQVCRQVLALEPGRADTLHLLGLTEHQSGRNVEAATNIENALKAGPDQAVYHSNLGLVYQALGRLGEAVRCHRRAVELDRQSPDSHNNLGTALAETGDLVGAAAAYREAIRLRPTFGQAQYNLGNSLSSQERLDEAVAAFREASRLMPASAEVRNNLGTALHKQGKLGEALICFQAALRLSPNFELAQKNQKGVLAEIAKFPINAPPPEAVAWYNEGNGLLAQGRLDDAIACYQKALAFTPAAAEIHTNLGNALGKRNKLDEAIACYRQALRIAPGYAIAHNNLGDALKDQGSLNEAIDCFHCAILLHPDFAQAHNNLGNALLARGQMNFVAEAIACYKRAIAIDPSFADAHNNLGSALINESKFDEAINCFRRAVELKPLGVHAHTNLAAVYTELGQVDEAIFHYEQALKIEPSDRSQLALATLLPPIYRSLEDLHSWRDRLSAGTQRLHATGVAIDLTTQPGTSLSMFYLAYQGENDRDLVRQTAQLYRAPIGIHLDKVTWRGEGKLRLGLISAHFRNHTIGQLMHGLIAALCRERFTVIVLAVGSQRDPLADAIRQSADVYVELPAHLPSARRAIAYQKLDLLYYTDIGMELITHALAFTRLAPIQCTTWGHPSTTGIDTIDYYISSEALDEESAQAHYTETLVRLRNLAICYHRPVLPAPANRATYGLPAGAHLYACPQSLFKFHPEFDLILREILRRDADGLLVLLHGKHSSWDQLLVERFSRTMPDVAQRVRFLPRQSRDGFLGLMAVSDVLLDPIHFGGGNSSYEGLAFGVPIVTLPSPYLRGRITWALYRRMGLYDCVAKSAEHYVEIAIRLGTDAAWRNEVSARILAANSVLYQNVEGVRELEAFFLRAAAGPMDRIAKRLTADPLNQRGLGHLARGENGQAAECFREAIALDSDLADAHNNLGIVLSADNKLDEAIASYRSALRLRPDFGQALYNLGGALKAQGKLDEAIECFELAQKQLPDSAEVCVNLGSALVARRKLDAAVEQYERALRINPDFAIAHNNLGHALHERRQLDEAIQHYQRAIVLEPRFGLARTNLGNAYLQQGRLDEAIDSYRQVLRIDPAYAEGYNNLGLALGLQGKLDEAIDSYHDALRLKADYPAAHSNMLLCLNYLGSDAGVCFAEHRRWAQLHAEQLGQSIPAHSNDLDPSRPLRIGYVSGDFRMHPVAFAIEPVLAAHDRNRVEVFCYAQVESPDDTTRRLNGIADNWRSLVGIPDGEAADMIRRDQIDILVDLAGHTSNNRLLVFARKPAPIQVTHFGYPNTTGLKTIDYRITDAHADPPGWTEAYHTEQLVRLPEIAWCYGPTESPDVNRLPALDTGYVTFGSLNNLAKVTSEVLGVWARVLHAVKNSRLLLLGGAGADADRRVLEHLQRCGIGRNRVTLVGRRSRFDYLKLHNEIDVGLDPFPYNGGVTTCDALWMGVPVVSLAGVNYVSRQGVSLLSNLGMTEYIADSVDAYVAAAARAASDLNRLSQCRAGLRQRMRASPIVDAAGFTRHLEDAYSWMWRNWLDANREGPRR
jgi:predicted O-linked N-acetylglucosamine transferase (SPINDLY family)